LPEQLDLKWKEEYTLKNIIEQYYKKTQEYNEFWKVMEFIDKNSWIIEPENPLYSHTSRRIAIGNHSSIQIEINPKSPYSICGILKYNKKIIIF
jgi:E3 ubiquitin-protein ligase FANCL